MYDAYCRDLIRVWKNGKRFLRSHFKGDMSDGHSESIEQNQGIAFDQLFAAHRQLQPCSVERIKTSRTIFLTGDIYLRLDDFGSTPYPTAECARDTGHRGTLWYWPKIGEERSAELFSLQDFS